MPIQNVNLNNVNLNKISWKQPWSWYTRTCMKRLTSIDKWKSIKWRSSTRSESFSWTLAVKKADESSVKIDRTNLSFFAFSFFTSSDNFFWNEESSVCSDLTSLDVDWPCFRLSHDGIWKKWESLGFGTWSIDLRDCVFIMLKSTYSKKNPGFSKHGCPV